jgi:hypothetical protein
MVQAQQELRVWYSDDYAQLMGAQPLNSMIVYYFGGRISQ